MWSVGLKSKIKNYLEIIMFKTDRITKVLLSLLMIGVWGVLLDSFFHFSSAGAQSKVTTDQSGQIPPVIKARGLVIVDEQGRDRIVLGSPIPDTKDGKRINPAHGMAILDPNGYERFGVGLMDNGQMAMGFDAPRGTGDDRNTERLHFVADADGGAMIRFLNRKTGVPGWIRLGEDDKLYLEFLDVQPDKNKVYRRRIGMDGEERLEEPFRK
jgi:hypothetical protein